MKRIYLDHNATTPVRREVRDAVIPFLEEKFGNPSSRHIEGRTVKSELENARTYVAEVINASPEEIVFNSCATEGNNAVLRGYWLNYKEKREKNHIITTAVEHPAVLSTVKYLEKNGFEVTVLGVDEYGRLDLAELEAAFRSNTGLVSVMTVNNEIGNIYPIKKITEIARNHGVLVHTDAVQAVGKMPVDVKDLDVDFLTLSGHKFYALKGAGALYMKKGKRLEPLLTGGHQEKNRRSGTENIIGIVAMGEALRLAMEEMEDDAVRIGTLRDYFESRVLAEIPYAKILGDPKNRIYATSNISFRFIEGEGILLKLDYSGISVSTGSACSSGSLEPSHVVAALGIDEEEAHSSIRFSLGKKTTKEEIDFTVDKLKEFVQQLRSFSPLYDRFISENKGE